MALYTRYSGSFLSRMNVVWRCDILQEAESAFTVEGLDFPADKPLRLEWKGAERHEPVQSSAATLKLISDTDRRFIDLYTVKAGSVRLDVYRNGSLFWSGSIDTEIYEEPYWTNKGYEVQLTFSDFGVLDRMPYDLSGTNTLRTLLETALARSAVNYSGIDESLISTSFTDGTALTLSGLSLPSVNFYDEDDEPSTWLEVLEGMLQPLALRIVQKAGKIWIYDINALFEDGSSEQIEWDGADSQLSAEAIYNNVKITFSPYGASSLADGDIDYGDTYGPEWTNLTSATGGVRYYGELATSATLPDGAAIPTCYSWYQDYDSDHISGKDGWDYNLVSFTMFLSADDDKCSGLASHGSFSYFHILPMLGGSESSGVAAGFYTGGHGSLGSGFPKAVGTAPSAHTQAVVMKTRRMFLPTLPANERKKVWIRVKVPLLYDPRYNPFEEASDYNEQGNYDTLKKYSDFAFVPVSIVVYDKDGKALYHYDNSWLTVNGQPASTVKALAEQSSYESYKASPSSYYWGWKSGAASFGDAWLSYYDPENLDGGTAIFGWQDNRQSFGKMRDGKYTDFSGDSKKFWMYDSFKKLPEGQCIPYPPEGGYLEVTVHHGVWVFCNDDSFSSEWRAGKFYDKGCYDKVRWYLFQAPQIDIVKSTFGQDSLSTDDVEYTGELLPDAKEGLLIDTICGTSPEAAPLARGCYLLAGGTQLAKLTRAGRTDNPEQLLIGTIYSQSAARSTILSGTAFSGVDRPLLLTDAAQDSGVKFILKSEVMDVRMDDSEVEMVEVREDNYTSAA